MTMTTTGENPPLSMPLDAWLDRLAQPTGAPGGGAACGLIIAVGASLLHMVAAYTPDDERAREAGERVLARRATALAAAETDGIRSSELGAALAEPDHPGRSARVHEAAIAAARSSVDLADAGAALRAEMRLLDAIGNPNLAADTEVAAAALEAGIRGALVNLRADIDLARAHGTPGDGTDQVLAPLVAAADEHEQAADAERADLAVASLTALERRGWDALCSGDGGDFYGDLMTDDAVMVLVNGAVLDREAVIASLADAPPWDEYELSDLRRVRTGQDSAAVVYRARATRAGAPPFEALMASTYRRVDGRVRLTLYQQTPLPTA